MVQKSSTCTYNWINQCWWIEPPIQWSEFWLQAHFHWLAEIKTPKWCTENMFYDYFKIEIRPSSWIKWATWTNNEIALIDNVSRCAQPQNLMYALLFCQWQNCQHLNTWIGKSNKIWRCDKSQNLIIPCTFLFYGLSHTCTQKLGRVKDIHTMQFFTKISRNTQSKSYAIIGWVCLGFPKWCIVGYSLTCLILRAYPLGSMGVQGAAIITSLSKLNLSTTCQRDNKFAQKTFWCYSKLPNK